MLQDVYTQMMAADKAAYQEGYKTAAETIVKQARDNGHVDGFAVSTGIFYHMPQRGQEAYMYLALAEGLDNIAKTPTATFPPKYNADPKVTFYIGYVRGLLHLNHPLLSTLLPLRLGRLPHLRGPTFDCYTK